MRLGYHTPGYSFETGISGTQTMSDGSFGLNHVSDSIFLIFKYKSYAQEILCAASKSDCQTRVSTNLTLKALN
jgi:hypothetical protein